MPARGSSCWLTWYDDNTGRGICADTVGPITSDQLPVRGKRIVRIDLGIPAKSLTASLSEQTLRGPPRRPERPLLGAAPPAKTP